MIVLYTTFPSIEVASSICKELVEKDIIKCANIHHAGTSIYKWENKMHSESEVFAYLKTMKDRIGDIEEIFKQLHPYDNPCLFEIKLDYIRPEFKDWIES
jgi:periplasmic divalent cation tolerance protein